MQVFYWHLTCVFVVYETIVMNLNRYVRFILIEIYQANICVRVLSFLSVTPTVTNNRKKLQHYNIYQN